jgi:G protein-coupled glucose receptor regulating Gpa2 C-term/G protein-coupled glucose receptor regulating Gpa2
MASGAFCFLIGLHTFASIIFNYRLGNVAFGLTILGLWGFLYLLPIIGVAMHPEDIFVRATSWCWINANYADLRIWLHYFWIFIFEFGTVLIYIALYVAIKCRIKSNYYGDNTKAQQARTAMKLMIVYPIVYVICTLPLATMRMASMNSVHITSYAWFCFAGAMITSNGWLDVVLYAMTRRIMLFSDEPPEDEYGVETFNMPFSGSNMRTFGNKTTCEYSGNESAPKSLFGTGWSKNHKGDLENQRSDITSYASTSQLFQPMTPSTPAYGPPSSKNDKGIAVRTKTIVQVTSEPIVELTDLRDARAYREKDFGTRSTSDKSEMELEFATKPQGWP